MTDDLQIKGVHLSFASLIIGILGFGGMVVAAWVSINVNITRISERTDRNAADINRVGEAVGKLEAVQTDIGTIKTILCATEDPVRRNYCMTVAGVRQ